MMLSLVTTSLSISTMHDALAQAVCECTNSPEKRIHKVAQTHNIASLTLTDHLNRRHVSLGKVRNRSLSLV